MTDYRRIVDDLRSFLQSRDWTQSTRLNALLTGYAEACEEANQRLRRCEEFLQQGMRSEAVHLAQAEPPLLDLVAILDFPELVELDEVPITYDLPATPKLLLATAEALNQAYAELQPLENLLREHRRLALARAPLDHRLAVMRKIAELDPANLLWEESIREFEKAHLREMQFDVDLALGRNDSDAVISVWHKINTTNWLVEPPLEMVQKLETLAKQDLERRTLHALSKLVAELGTAVARRDLAAALKLRDQWHVLAEEAHLSPTHLTWRKAEGALDWVDQQERLQARELEYQNALQEFEEAMEEGAPEEEVTHLYHTVLQRKGTLPQTVLERYQQHLKRMRAASSHRERLILGVTFSAGAVVLLGLIIFFVSRARVGREVEQAVQELDDMRVARQFASGKERYAELRQKAPGVAENLDVVAAHHRLLDAERQELQNEEDFQRALAEAKNAPLEEREPPALLRAEVLAVGRRERSAGVDALRNEREQQRQRKIDGTLELSVEQQEHAVRKLEDMIGGDFDAAAAVKLQLGTERAVARLVQESTGASTRMLQKIKALSARLEIARNQLDKLGPENLAEREVNAALGASPDLERYIKALQKYADAFAGTDRARAFQQAIAERNGWQEVIDWAVLIEPRLARPLDLTPAEAANQIEALGLFLKDHPQFVDVSVAREYLQCLEAIVQQDPRKDGSAPAKLRQLLSDPLIKDLWIVRSKKGDKVYYTQADIIRKWAAAAGEGSISFQYLAGFDGKKTGKTSELKDIEAPMRAPQSVLAEKLQRTLDESGKKGWEQAMVGILQQMHDDVELDPILQLILIKHVLECSAKSSYLLAQALRSQQAHIDNTRLDLTVPWMNPDNEGADIVRAKARAVIEKLPSLQPVLKAAGAQRHKLEVALRRTDCPVVGRLARDKERGWQCRLVKRQLPAPYHLSVLIPAQGQAPVWKPVGNLANGKATVDRSVPEALLEGRLVFARKDEE
jgi:hypothetical protein